jgi:hypothetical protein
MDTIQVGTYRVEIRFAYTTASAGMTYNIPRFDSRYFFFSILLKKSDNLKRLENGMEKHGILLIVTPTCRCPVKVNHTLYIALLVQTECSSKV